MPYVSMYMYSTQILVIFSLQSYHKEKQPPHYQLTPDLQFPRITDHNKSNIESKLGSLVSWY